MPRTRKPAPPGSAHNRTDQAIPKVPTGLPYGEATQLASAQAAVPVAAPAGPDMAQAADAASRYPTGHVTTLDAPTQNPHEPVTSGLPTGAGPGPDFAQVRNDPSADIVTRLEAFYMRWPTVEMRKLLTEARGH